MEVPFLDLKTQCAALRREVLDSLASVIDQAAFAGGPFVAQFEGSFAAFTGSSHVVGVSSGTSALWLALLALEIGPGDEVITVPNTFIATAEAISFCGATPVFVDVDEKTYTMDPAGLAAAITPRTKAVIPVHLFGQMADMDPIAEIARSHGLRIIEDAAQAHGATYKGRPPGAVGDVACYSFYPGKNLGAFGEAGALASNDARLAQAARVLRDHGQAKKYHHVRVGWNARMDGIQGAVLSVKLGYLARWNDARRRHARRYAEVLAGIDGLVLPHEADYARHVYHVYAVQAPNRDALVLALQAQGVACGIHYPTPLHLTDAYRGLGYAEGAFPVAERCASRVVSLPMFPELSEDQIAHVAEALRELVAAPC